MSKVIDVRVGGQRWRELACPRLAGSLAGPSDEVRQSPGSSDLFIFSKYWIGHVLVDTGSSSAFKNIFLFPLLFYVGKRVFEKLQ